jgi:hypothetical protein
MNIYFEGPKYQNRTFECASKFVAVLLVKKNPSSRGGQANFFKSPGHGWDGEQSWAKLIFNALIGLVNLTFYASNISKYLRYFNV